MTDWFHQISFFFFQSFLTWTPEFLKVQEQSVLGKAASTAMNLQSSLAIEFI